MITITRSLVRQLRAALRKAGLGKSGSQPDAFVHVSTDNDGLRLRVAGPESSSSIGSPAGSIPLRSCCRSRSWPPSKDARKSQSRSMLPIRAKSPLAFLSMVCRSCSNEPSTVKPNSPLGPSCQPLVRRTRQTCGQRCATPWPRLIGSRLDTP